jgi:hypothetical protein
LEPEEVREKREKRRKKREGRRNAIFFLPSSFFSLISATLLGGRVGEAVARVRALEESPGT